MYFFRLLDVTVVINESSFNTGIRKYKGDYYSPKGHKYIEELEMETIPSRIYRVGGVKLRHERLLVHYEEQYLARFTILEASEPINPDTSVPDFQKIPPAHACQSVCQYKSRIY